MKRMMWSLLIGLSAFILSGCWDQRELNELALVSASGVDVVKGRLLMTAQVVLPSVISASASGSAVTGGRAATVLVTSSGNTVMDALENMSREAPRHLYLAYTRIIVIGEDAARRGIRPVVNYFMRNPGSRETTQVAVVHGRACDLLSVITTQEKIPANDVLGILNVEESTLSNQWRVPLYQLADSLSQQNAALVIPSLSVHGDLKGQVSIDALKVQRPHARIITGGMAVFHEDRLVGWLSDAESNGLAWFAGRIKKSKLDVRLRLKSGVVTVSFRVTKADVQKKIPTDHGRIQVFANVKAEGEVGQVGGELQLTKPEIAKQIEKAVSQNIKDQILRIVTVAQKKYRLDFLGVGDLVYELKPRLWHQVERRWDSVFPFVSVVVKVDSKVLKVGMINDNLGTPMR